MGITCGSGGRDGRGREEDCVGERETDRQTDRQRATDRQTVASLLGGERRAGVVVVVVSRSAGVVDRQSDGLETE